MYENVWVKSIYIGRNEYVILRRKGTDIYFVIDAYNYDEKPFKGSFEECLDYCTKCWIEYQESIAE